MKEDVKQFLKFSLLELLVYGLLVTGYFFLVLHFLGELLQDLFLHERKTYALVALALIIGQGVGLEIITTALLKLIKRKID